MEEGREVSAVLDGRLDETLSDQLLAAAASAPIGEKVRIALECAVELAEADPEEARRALWALRADADLLKRLEDGLGLAPGRATLSLGAAIQLASSELSSAAPDLRSRVPELLRWLKGDW